MELRHLRYFQAVSRTLNFSRAAEQLHVAQPALSRQIRDLEAELGTRLFDRNRVRVQLTDAGRTLASHVPKLLAELDLAVESVRATQAGTAGKLMICNDWRVSIQLIPATVIEFRTRHPGVEVSLVDLPVHEQITALRAGRAHICFQGAEAISSRVDLASMPILRTEIKLLVSEQHRLANRRRVRLTDLRNETFIQPIGKDEASYAAFVAQNCRLAGFSPIFTPQKASSAEALVTLVGAGLGIALIPGFASIADRPFVRSISTDCEPIEIHAVWLRTEGSTLLREYLEIVKAHTGGSPSPSGQPSS